MEVVVRVNLHLYSRQGIVRNEGLNEREKGYPPPSFLANTSNPTTAQWSSLHSNIAYSLICCCTLALPVYLLELKRKI